MKRYRKDDIETRGGFPAVNIKVRKRLEPEKLPLNLGSSYPVGHPELEKNHYTDPAFTHEWIEEHVSEEVMDACFWDACGQALEYIENNLSDPDSVGLDKPFFPRPVRMEIEGRSDGWLVILGLRDLESWDAVAVSRWGRFERFCRQQAERIPWDILSDLYLNIFLPRQADQETPHA